MSGNRKAAISSRSRRFGLAAAVFVVLVGAWWLVTALGVVPPAYLPSPGAVIDAFVQANTCRPISEGSSRVVCGEFDYYMWQHLLASLGRIGIGVGAAIVLGPIAGFLMGTIGWLRDALDPYLNFLRALPPLGYVGLLIVWFGIGDVSKYWLLFLAAFPPLVIATMNGVRGVKQDHIRAARSMGASHTQVATRVLLPSVLPELLSGIRIATGLAWTTVVAAELNNGIPGIGGLAYQAGTQIQTALTIASIIVIGIVAVALDSLIKFISRILTPWHGRA